MLSTIIKVSVVGFCLFIWTDSCQGFSGRGIATTASLSSSLSSSSALFVATGTTDVATSSRIRPDLAEQMGSEPSSKFMIDVDEMYEKSTFSIPPEQLISLAKAFTAAQVDGNADSWFADDFRFVAPVVGPFEKDEFLDSVKSFDLATAFPDLSFNYHHYRVCPFEPNRVWYSIKQIGTNTGPVMGRPATNKKIESPIQSHSVTFNEKGEVTKFTIGYVMDKETGNTGGLGGVFGLFYAIGYGLPFPEAQPYKPSPVYGSLMGVNKQIQNVFKSNPQVKNTFQSIITQIGGKKD